MAKWRSMIRFYCPCCNIWVSVAGSSTITSTYTWKVFCIFCCQILVRQYWSSRAWIPEQNWTFPQKYDNRCHETSQYAIQFSWWFRVGSGRSIRVYFTGSQVMSCPDMWDSAPKKRSRRRYLKGDFSSGANPHHGSGWCTAKNPTLVKSTYAGPCKRPVGPFASPPPKCWPRPPNHALYFQARHPVSWRHILIHQSIDCLLRFSAPTLWRSSWPSMVGGRLPFSLTLTNGWVNTKGKYIPGITPGICLFWAPRAMNFTLNLLEG